MNGDQHKEGVESATKDSNSKYYNADKHTKKLTYSEVDAAAVTKLNGDQITKKALADEKCRLQSKYYNADAMKQAACNKNDA